jgi:hypothetical protein
MRFLRPAKDVFADVPCTDRIAVDQSSASRDALSRNRRGWRRGHRVISF